MKYTETELRLMRAWYPQIGATGMVRLMRYELGIERSPQSIMQKAAKMGLRYTGPKKCLFTSQSAPWNKGVKMWPEWKAKCAPGMFKPGHICPHRVKHDGAITIRDRNRTPTPYIRLAMSKWAPLARHNWEQVNGPMPPSHVIKHRDGNTLNCDADNLYIISRAHNLANNQNRKKAAESIRLAWDRRKIEAAGSFIDAVLQCRI